MPTRASFGTAAPAVIATSEIAKPTSHSFAALPAAVQELVVGIVRARGLRNPDSIGDPNPYCIMEIPGKPEATRQTEVADHSKDPVWDEQFRVKGYDTGDILEFTLFDEDPWPRKDDVLGRLHLRSDQFLPNGFNGEMPLDETNGEASFLTVSVWPADVPGAEYVQPNTVAGAHAAADGSGSLGSKDAPGTDSCNESLDLWPELSVAVRFFHDFEAPFVSERNTSIQQVDSVASMANDLVTRLRNEITQRVEVAREDFEEYQKIEVPTTYEHQCARNASRGKLELMVQNIQKDVEQIICASQTPCDALQAAKRSSLTRVDNAIKRLTLLRNETLRLYEEREVRLERDRDEDERRIAEMALRLEKVDAFVQCVAGQVAVETAEGQELHQNRLNRLMEEEARYIRANDALEKNPAFTKLRDEIRLTRDRLEKQSDRQRAGRNLLDGWVSLLRKMPKIEAPKKRYLWQLW